MSKELAPTGFPAIQTPNFWEQCRTLFPKEHDYLVSFVKALRDGKADYIYIDDRRKELQIKAATFAEEHGLLSFEEKGSDEAQYTRWEYRPTELGKRLFLDPNAPNKYHLPE